MCDLLEERLMCDRCGCPDHFGETRREPTEEEIAEFIASREPRTELDALSIAVAEATRYWDSRRQSYPKHLQSAIRFLEGQSTLAQPPDSEASSPTLREKQPSEVAVPPSSPVHSVPSKPVQNKPIVPSKHQPEDSHKNQQGRTARKRTRAK